MADEKSAFHSGNVSVLIADSDVSVREILRYCFKEEDWSCDEARDGISALKLLRRRQYHIILLEAELPELNGELVCTQIRKDSRIPVIFLGKRTAEEYRLSSFAAGGNDYIVKPFFPREVVARMKSFLYLFGVSSEPREMLAVGKIGVNPLSHSVKVDGRDVPLTPREYDLLIFFMKNPGKAFPRDVILDLVWGKNFYGTDRTVDTHIKSLRNKIKPCQGLISTVWGYGYKFEAPE